MFAGLPDSSRNGISVPFAARVIGAEAPDSLTNGIEIALPVEA